MNSGTKKNKEEIGKEKEKKNIKELKNKYIGKVVKKQQKGQSAEEITLDSFNKEYEKSYGKLPQEGSAKKTVKEINRNISIINKYMDDLRNELTKKELPSSKGNNSFVNKNTPGWVKKAREKAKLDKKPETGNNSGMEIENQKPTNPEENPDGSLEDKSRRDFIKKVGAALGVTAVLGVLRDKVEAKENSREKILSPEKAVAEALNHKKYTHNSRDFKTVNDGYWDYDENGNGSNSYGVPLGFTKQQIADKNDIVRNWSYGLGREKLLNRDMPKNTKNHTNIFSAN